MFQRKKIFFLFVLTTFRRVHILWCLTALRETEKILGRYRRYIDVLLRIIRDTRYIDVLLAYKMIQILKK